MPTTHPLALALLQAERDYHTLSASEDDKYADRYDDCFGAWASAGYPVFATDTPTKDATIGDPTAAARQWLADNPGHEAAPHVRAAFASADRHEILAQETANGTPGETRVVIVGLEPGRRIVITATGTLDEREIATSVVRYLALLLQGASDRQAMAAEHVDQQLAVGRDERAALRAQIAEVPTLIEDVNDNISGARLWCSIEDYNTMTGAERRELVDWLANGGALGDMPEALRSRTRRLQ